MADWTPMAPRMRAENHVTSHSEGMGRREVTEGSRPKARSTPVTHGTARRHLELRLLSGCLEPSQPHRVVIIRSPGQSSSC